MRKITATLAALALALGVQLATPLSAAADARVHNNAVSDRYLKGVTSGGQTIYLRPGYTSSWRLDRIWVEDGGYGKCRYYVNGVRQWYTRWYYIGGGSTPAWVVIDCYVPRRPGILV